MNDHPQQPPVFPPTAPPRPDFSEGWRSPQAGLPVPPARRPRWRLHLGLFVATIASTFMIGYLLSRDPAQAAGYSAAIMSILLVHEMGHFVMCLRYQVPATLPYFIPIPIPPFGTMGAVIRMRGQLRSRTSVFDIGAAGPLAGLAVAIPVTYFGLKISQIIGPEDPALTAGGIQLGDSLLFGVLTRAVFGELPPDADVLLHPVALAGWAGLFVTGLNLLPVGQLDGGHVIYAMIGRRAQWVGGAVLGGLILLTVFYHHAWWPLVLLLLYMRPGHPPAVDMQPLDQQRLLLGILMMALFVLTFVPRPIVVGGP